ncbi:bifunctional adenosylcobinamide kinase/adenosylcobinamide-phosphate guanylyltransferase [Pleionea litopenaei]|uniref:Bifunctional adenosylcobalamin biosynthesis protein n=1 Tax=Pleionea litopenaei TaxID=3070815 RepID=A0AA51X5Q8_9GAMM|nr:bifunctional adenosylcobinamide kinase/adenosylcobinamide-phosphate guanylyltransferase [Pleionea sp. HL-JVS1]WMS86079.1 bifunctional adenosylcobinamide kinase/adenosylcobinamide-phosphate guanylyltransferase [Pleionea sp. HL-JVS1]
MIHLVLGGARSGKSHFAETLASNLTQDTHQPVTYLATATMGDDEMIERISQHKLSRPNHWRLVEEPFHLAEAIASNENSSVILLDCMTLWLSNWLCSHDPEAFTLERDALIDELLKRQKPIVIVSNEVGSGIVPMGELSRQFADQAGWLNQALAAIATEVTLVVAGCPLTLKSTTTARVNDHD